MSDVTFSFGGDATEFNKAIGQIKQNLTAQLSQMKQQIVANSGTIQNSFNSISQNSQVITASLRNFAFGAYSAFAFAQSGVRLFSTSFSLLKTALNEAGDIESIRLNYIQFCGDAEKADMLIEKLRDKAVKSPYETNDLLKSGNALLSAGIEASRVFDIVSSIAAVSGGSGQTLNELSLAMSKGFARQKFQTEQVMAFAQRGINILPQLEIVTGKTGDALNKAIEKGLGFDQVAEALARLTQKGGQYFGLMEKQGDSWNGLMSTMSGGIKELMVAFAEPIKDGIKPYLSQINALISELMPKAVELGRNMIDAFSFSLSKMESVKNALVSIATGSDSVSMCIRDLLVTFVLLRLGVDKAVMAMGHALRMNLFGALAAIKLQAISMGGSFATLRAAVTLSFATMATGVKSSVMLMAASFKGAMIAMKGALISTGIGAVLVLLGETAAYIYGKIMASGEEAKAIQEQAVDLEKSKRKESRDIDKISDEASMISKKQQLEERIKELMDTLQMEEEKKSESAINGIMNEINMNKELLRKLEKEAPARIRVAEAAAKQKEQIRELNRIQQEMIETMKKNAEDMDKLIKKSNQAREEKQIAGQSFDVQRRYALSLTGLESLDEIERKINDFSQQITQGGVMTDKDKSSLDNLLKARDTLEEIAQKRKEINLSMQQEKQEYQMRISMIQAELEGNNSKLAALKEQKKIMEETGKYMRAGFGEREAEKMAKKLVSMESSKEQQDQLNSDVSRYNGTTADSKARVGGGGIGFTISVQPLLNESRKQTNVLEKIKEYLPKLEGKQQTSTSVGIIGV